MTFSYEICLIDEQIMDKIIKSLIFYFRHGRKFCYWTQPCKQRNIREKEDKEKNYFGQSSQRGKQGKFSLIAFIAQLIWITALKLTKTLAPEKFKLNDKEL